VNKLINLRSKWEGILDVASYFGTAYMYFLNIIKSLTLLLRKINVFFFRKSISVVLFKPVQKMQVLHELLNFTQI